MRSVVCGVGSPILGDDGVGVAVVRALGAVERSDPLLPRPMAVARGTHLGQGHEPSVPQALALAERVLGARMPSRVWVVAIEAAELHTFSERLTPAVQAAVPAAVDQVLLLLRDSH